MASSSWFSSIRCRPRIFSVRPVLLLVGVGLLMAAFAGSNPLGLEPDGPEHFIKAVGAGTGQWRGEPGRLRVAKFGRNDQYAPIRIAWINGSTRSFEMPAKFGRRPGACQIFSVSRPYNCEASRSARPTPVPTPATSYVGTYEPIVYTLIGRVMLMAPDRTSAYYTGRAATVFLCLILLGLAFFALWDPRAGPLSLLGPVLAITPTVLFLAGSLGTNGVEVVSSLVMFAVVLRTASPNVRLRHGWLVVGVAAVLCAVSRATGPLWVAAAGLLALYLHGLRPSLRKVRASRRRSLPVLAAIGAAVLSTELWDYFVQNHPQLDLGWAAHSVGRAFHDLFTVSWRQWLGAFGWASFGLPRWTSLLWLAMFLLVAVAALHLAPRRTAVRLGVGVAAVLAAVVLLELFVFYQTHFPAYGRYVLGLVVVIPLALGESLLRSGGSPGVGSPGVGGWKSPLPGLLASIAFPAAGCLAAFGVWVNARRYAVGVYGPWNFVGRSGWQPPLGWQPWLMTAILGGLAIALSGLPPRRVVPAAVDRASSGEPAVLAAAVTTPLPDGPVACPPHVKGNAATNLT